MKYIIVFSLLIAFAFSCKKSNNNQIAATFPASIYLHIVGASPNDSVKISYMDSTNKLRDLTFTPGLYEYPTETDTLITASRSLNSRKLFGLVMERPYYWGYYYRTHDFTINFLEKGVIVSTHNLNLVLSEYNNKWKIDIATIDGKVLPVDTAIIKNGYPVPSAFGIDSSISAAAYNGHYYFKYQVK